MSTLLYLHGVGDNGSRRDWLEVLRAQWGEDDDSSFDLLAPDFSDLLAARTHMPQAPPIPRSAETASPESRRLYRAAQAITYAKLLDAGSTPVWPYEPRGFARVPGVLDAAAERIITKMLFEEVRRYVSDAGLREAVRARVINSLGDRRSLVVLGHSLGALVALDLIQHLPHGTDVSLLVTAASPLARSNLPKELDDLRDQFPYDRVHGWINVFNPSDAATRGRPIGLKFPAALDVCVAGHFQDHALATCVADSGVSAALGAALGKVGSATRDPDVDLVGPDQELAGPDQLLSRPELLYLGTLQIGFRMEQLLVGQDDARPADVSAFWSARRLAGERSIPRGTDGRQIWDMDHREDLHGRAAERDIPAVLVRLANVNPLETTDVPIPMTIEEQARRQVAIDIGLPPGWVDIAARSLAEAQAALGQPESDSAQDSTEVDPSEEDLLDASHITTSIHLALAPLVLAGLIPTSRRPSGIVDLTPLCVELAARAQTAHQLGTPKAGLEERTALSRLMLILGQYKVQISAKPGTREHLTAELRSRMRVVGTALSLLAERRVGLAPAR
ncbi:MAG: hypothetical protein U0990_05230 [Candidatus Nanopelagicales bacterium]|nr:hypothetical protein [Candidatus Nanopelagicales bacterium]MDZ4249477.1 hypothetical protein [Candidatus Nanopelagicales bacterium]